jgi:chromate transporter
MAASACAVLAAPWATTQLAVVAVAGIFGALVFKPAASATPATLPIAVSPRAALAALGVFAVLLIGLPWLSAAWPHPVLTMVDAFYRAGALVFGGGHVVLPLLQAELLPMGGISDEVFLAGYGATQAVPGPLFTFAAFLGASLQTGPGGALGAIIALVAIFLPSFLLVVGALPFWARLRLNTRAQAALSGVNASVVGLLLAVLYDPAWTSAIHQPADFALALVALIALIFWKLPPWSVVLGCAAIGWVMSL